MVWMLPLLSGLDILGTSVGAKTLTMAQAVLIAGIFEFVGAIVLGRVSTATIAGGIADIKEFKDEPYVYA